MPNRNTREFIMAAEDCPRDRGTVPYSEKGQEPFLPLVTYEVLARHPYEYTEDELQREVHVARLGKDNFDPATRDLKRNDLPKKWGWGIHYDEERRVSLVDSGTERYEQLAKRAEAQGKLDRALRNKRA